MPKRILVVDDEPNIVISVEYLLRREGYEVAAAGDGDAALRALEENPVDLVVLDVMLPTMSGFDVCERIRAHPLWRRIKIVMLTARGRDTEIAKGLRLGADVYVTKPFSTHELVTKIKQQLGDAP
jgi:DNA-binding response OmpR family regulator